MKSLFIMETQKRLPKSTRKYIRLQKAFIRKNFFDLKKQEEQISNLYKKYFPDIINKETKEKTTTVDEVKQNAEKSPKPLGHRPLGRSSTGEPTGEAKKVKGKLSKKISKE